MLRRVILSVLVSCWFVAGAGKSTAAAGSSVRYVPLDAPAGMSQAVVVDALPLVYTRQLLPLDEDGNVIGPKSAEQQIERVLDNLEAVLGEAGSGLDRLVRLNVCALSHDTARRPGELLAQPPAPEVRPAISTVLTPMPRRNVLVALDGVAVGDESEEDVVLKRCDGIMGGDRCADAAVLPPGGVVYLSGQPAKGELARSAVAGSLSTLFARFEQLALSKSDVVRLKVFLSPASSADEALAEIERCFPDRLMPPVVFVEWIASAPVEIELVARLPASGDSSEPVELYDPPAVKPSPTFSRAAIVRSPRQIFVSGLCSREAGDAEAQARDVFEQLTAILAETGAELPHLAKATYYVSDDDASRALDIARPKWFAGQRPPAASKVTVHGVGRRGRTLSVDMIAAAP